MSGDLEDFLRRAAARRQQQAAQAPPQPARRQPPQYSNRHTERVTRVPESDEPILAAELLEEESPSIAAQLRRVEESKRKATRLKSQVAQQNKTADRRATDRSTSNQAATPTTTGNPAQELIRMLRRPGGIQQAILLREILDRPEHRW